MKFGCLLGLFGLPACSVDRPPPSGPGAARASRELADRVASRPELAVLFVGNSYTFGVPRAFAKLAAARGKTVRVGHSANGGWTLAQHAANDSTLRKIRGGRWDIVVLQEQSEIPALPARKRAEAMFPPLRQLATEAREAGAIPVLYQTWGRQQGDPHVRGDDFHAMSARLRAGYQAASADSGGLVVIPVGDYWEKEMSAGRGAELFLPDGSHPTQMGNELTAAAFCDAFFGK